MRIEDIKRKLKTTKNQVVVALLSNAISIGIVIAKDAK
jgi:hypothetical protein